MVLVEVMRSYSLKKIFAYTFLFLLIAFSSIAIFKKDNYRYELSVIAIFQDEARFLKEWLDFYRVLGVEHFYLFNNLSDDGYAEVLAPYIKAGLVELHNWPYASEPGHKADWTAIHSAAYRKGLELANGESKWVALVDTDEFMFPKKQDSLIDFLKDYEECSGLLVNWQLFGTSHVERIADNQLMIESLVMQSPPDCRTNRNCKSIVRPEKVKYCNCSNCVIHYPWTYSVDCNKRVFFWNFYPFRPVNIEKIQINHYWSRDEEFFHTNKLARHENWGNQKSACVQLNEEANQVINLEILQFAPRVRQLQEQDPILSSS